jgi:hypothetical protein
MVVKPPQPKKNLRKMIPLQEGKDIADEKIPHE